MPRYHCAWPTTPRAAGRLVALFFGVWLCTAGAGCAMTVQRRMLSAACHPATPTGGLTVYVSAVRAGPGGIRRFILELTPDGGTARELPALPESEKLLEIRVEGNRGDHLRDVRARAAVEAASCGADALVVLGERINRRSYTYAVPITWTETRRVGTVKITIEKQATWTVKGEYNAPAGYYLGIRFADKQPIR